MGGVRLFLRGDHQRQIALAALQRATWTTLSDGRDGVAAAHQWKRGTPVAFKREKW